EMLAVLARLALVDHMRLDLLHDLKVSSDAVEGQAAEALTGRTGAHDVAVLRGVPAAENLLTREVHRRRLLQRHGIHRTPARQIDEIGAHLADLQPDRLLLEA